MKRHYYAIAHNCPRDGWYNIYKFNSLRNRNDFLGECWKDKKYNGLVMPPSDDEGERILYDSLKKVSVEHLCRNFLSHDHTRKEALEYLRELPLYEELYR